MESMKMKKKTGQKKLTFPNGQQFENLREIISIELAVLKKSWLYQQSKYQLLQIIVMWKPKS